MAWIAQAVARRLPTGLDGWSGAVQSLVHVMVAMAPCVRLYAFLGSQLARTQRNNHIVAASGSTRGPRGHPYSHWIRNYTSAAYVKLPAAMERMIDTLGPAQNYGESIPAQDTEAHSFHGCRSIIDAAVVWRFGCRWAFNRFENNSCAMLLDAARPCGRGAESLQGLYCTAMRFEAEFFSDHDGAPGPARVAVLGVDFDETCSRDDTIGAVIAAAIDAAAGRAEGGRLAAPAKAAEQRHRSLPT